MAALRIPREIRDAVQNHKPQGIGDRAYNFHDYADEKREALQRWADHVEKLVKSSRGIRNADRGAQCDELQIPVANETARFPLRAP